MKLVDRLLSALIVSIFLLVVVAAIGPTVIELIERLIILALVVGLAAGLLRALFYFTNRW
jgi:uncharacterized protein YqhQ